MSQDGGALCRRREESSSDSERNLRDESLLTQHKCLHCRYLLVFTPPSLPVMQNTHVCQRKTANIIQVLVRQTITFFYLCICFSPQNIPPFYTKSKAFHIDTQGIRHVRSDVFFMAPFMQVWHHQRDGRHQTVLSGGACSCPPPVSGLE